MLNGIPACRILSLARTSRLLIADGATRYADAILFASSPSTVCKISGERTLASIAGCAHANISPSRSSGIPASISAASRPSAITRISSDAISTLFRPRYISIVFRRATVSSHASGFSGQPFAGQSASAAANASDNASSAAATSRVRPVRGARRPRWRGDTC